MKKYPVVVALLSFFLFILLIACSKDDASFPVGESWVSSDTKVYFIDTVTVESSTFKFDSISVSGADRYLIGAYTDSVFGLTKSKLFAQLSNTTYSIDDDAQFDSIALILNYDNYYYSDTTKLQTFTVHKVLQNIKPEEESFYNTSSYRSDPASIGSITFKPKPIREDSIHLLLNNDFGKTLFDNLQNDVINNSDEFLSAYKGLLIDPDDNNTVVLGFATSSFLRIYYTLENETEDDEETLDISFSATNTFNNISSEQADTYFENLAEQQDLISSKLTNNSSFIQAGTGIATRISIPFIERINDINGQGTILDANLKISLKGNSDMYNLFTRDSLQLYIIDQKNQVLGQLYDYSGANAEGLLTQKNEEFKTINYTIPVQLFLDQKLSQFNGENWYLALYSSNYNTSVDRYILNGEAAKEDLRLKLELTYAVYDEDE